MSPWLALEVQTRWRKWQSFKGLLYFSIFLASACILYYNSQIPSDTPQAGKQVASLRGADLLFTLARCGFLAIFAMVPGLTANTVAMEREKNTLDSLLLTHYSTLAMLVGKMVGVFAYASILFLTSIPIVALCFLLGGVAPVEILKVAVILIGTLYASTCLGLWASSTSLDAERATRRATVWLILVFFLTPLIQLSAPDLDSASILHPDGALQQVIYGEGPKYPLIPEKVLAVYLTNFLAMFAVGSGALIMAARALQRPMEPAPPVAPLEYEPPYVKAPADTPGETIFVPVASTASFLNPVLQREFRSRFRMRQPPSWVVVFETVLALAVLYAYAHVMVSAFLEPRSRLMVALGTIAMAGFIGIPATFNMSALAMTRDIRQKTWDQLKLSSLSPGEITAGKILSSFYCTLAFSVVIWPMLLVCLLPPYKADDLMYPLVWKENGLGLVLVPALILYLHFLMAAAMGVWVGAKIKSGKGTTIYGLPLLAWWIIGGTVLTGGMKLLPWQTIGISLLLANLWAHLVLTAALCGIWWFAARMACRKLSIQGE